MDKCFSSLIMSSSRAVGLYSILFVVLCGASKDPRQRVTVHDEDGLQREVTFSPEELEDMMLQRPIIHDLSSFIKMKELEPIQGEDTNFHPEDVPRGFPMFGPRSMGPNVGPEVHFPPAYPSVGNLEDICQFSKASLRYPENIFPPSGFGGVRRQAEAVNRLQPWYDMCCGLNGTDAEKMCCAEQAWKKTLFAFCDEEFSIKTVPHFCCKKNGKARWICFDKEAPATSYDIPFIDFDIDNPRKEQGFKFNPSSCKGSSVASPRALKKNTETLDITFPPGRPDSSNIALICAHRKIRPRYLTRCLPRTGYGWLARQSKAINVLEKEYNQCCKEKKAKHHCAERKWKKMVDKFCKDERKTKGKHFECCDKKKGEEQYSCFASTAQDPSYSFIDGVFAPPAAPPNLDSFCDIHTSLQTMTGFPFQLDEMVGRCCPLVLQERPSCIETELNSHLDVMCEVKELKPYCCAPNIKNRGKCATKRILRYMAKAKTVNNRGRKKCPLIGSEVEM